MGRAAVVRLVAVVAAGVLAAAVVWPAPASAHGRLVTSTPAQGSTLKAPADSVSLAFTEKPAEFAFFAVITPSGLRVDQAWEHAAPFRLEKPVMEYQLVAGAWQPREFNAGFPARVPVSHWPQQGLYTVRYQSVASDGEAVQGEVQFTYSGAVTAAPPGWKARTEGPSDQLIAATGKQRGPSATAQQEQAARTPEPDGNGPWPWLVPVLLVVGVGGAVALAVTGPNKRKAAPAKKT